MDDATPSRFECHIHQNGHRVALLEISPKKLPLNDYENDADKWMKQATGIPGLPVSRELAPPFFERTVRVNDAQGGAIPTVTPAPVLLADEASLFAHQYVLPGRSQSPTVKSR
mgnify:FL=1